VERSRYRSYSGRDMKNMIVALLTFVFFPHDAIRVSYSAKTAVFSVHSGNVLIITEATCPLGGTN